MSTDTSGSLKVGGVYVSVSVALGDAARSLKAFAKQVEQIGKQVRESMGVVANVGGLFAAGMAAAVAAAAQTNRAIAKDLEHLKRSVLTLASEVGEAFAPYLKQLAAMMTKVVGAFQRLSPETKAAAARFALLAAGAGGAAGILGRVAGVVEGVAKGVGFFLVPALDGASKGMKALGPVLVKSTIYFNNLMRTVTMGDLLAKVAAGFKGLGASIAGAASAGPTLVASLSRMALSMGAILAPVLAVTAALAGLTLLAAALNKAWSYLGVELKALLSGVVEQVTDIGMAIAKTAGGWVDSVTGAATAAWEVLVALGSGVAGVVSGWFSSLASFLTAGLRATLNVVASMVSKAAAHLEPMARMVPGMGVLADTLNGLSKLTGDQLLSGLGEAGKLLMEPAKKAADYLGSTVKSAGRELVERAEQAGRAVAKIHNTVRNEAGEAITYAFEWNKDAVKQLFADSGLGGLLEGLKDLPKEWLAGLTGWMNGPDGKLATPFAEQDKEQDRGLKQFEGVGTRKWREVRAGFADFERETLRLAEEMRRRVQEARESLVNRALGSLGQLGTIISNAMQAAAAGPMAVLASVSLDLLSQSQGFQEVMEILNAILQRVADALGAILVPLQPLLGALFLLIDSGLKALAPAFEALGAMIKPLVPPLVLLGELLNGLAPVIHVVIQVVMLVTMPLKILGGPVMRALFTVLKFVSNVILTVAKAIGTVWNAIIDAIIWVLKAIDKVPFVDMGGAIAAMRGARVDINAMSDAQKELNAVTWEGAYAKAQETAEVLKNHEALKAVNEALTNVPSIFKANLRRYQSEDGELVLPTVPRPSSPPPGQSGGSYSGPPGGTSGGQAGPAVVMGDITLYGVDPEKVMAELQRRAEDTAYRITGNRGTSPSRYNQP